MKAIQYREDGKFYGFDKLAGSRDVIRLKLKEAKDFIKSVAGIAMGKIKFDAQQLLRKLK